MTLNKQVLINFVQLETQVKYDIVWLSLADQVGVKAQS